MLTGFSLYQPADGRPAPDSTFVRVVSQYTATRRAALVDPRTGSVIVFGSRVFIKGSYVLRLRPTS